MWQPPISCPVWLNVNRIFTPSCYLKLFSTPPATDRKPKIRSSSQIHVLSPEFSSTCLWSPDKNHTGWSHPQTSFPETETCGQGQGVAQLHQTVIIIIDPLGHKFLHKQIIILTHIKLTDRRINILNHEGVGNTDLSRLPPPNLLVPSVLLQQPLYLPLRPHPAVKLHGQVFHFPLRDRNHDRLPVLIHNPRHRQNPVP